MKASDRVLHWDHRSDAPIRKIVRLASQIPDCDAFMFYEGGSEYWLILAKDKDDAIMILKQCIPLKKEDTKYIKIWNLE